MSYYWFKDGKRVCDWEKGENFFRGDFQESFFDILNGFCDVVEFMDAYTGENIAIIYKNESGEIVSRINNKEIKL